jgi:hypothetical protein
MQEAMVSPLSTWGNFYTIMGSAAATLTGLMFIVVTLTAGTPANRVRRSSGMLAAFGTPNIVHFCSALLIAATLSAPWQMLWNVSLLLGIAGLGGVVYIIVVVLRTRHQTEYRPVLEDWMWHNILPFISYTIIVVAAIVLPLNPVPALFAIGAVTLLFLFIGIHNAWDTVTYITLQQPQPENKSQDE